MCSRDTAIAGAARDRLLPADDGRIARAGARYISAMTVPSTVRLQREPFDAAAEAATLTRGRTDIGAVVTFTGICRGAEAGEPIAALTLEHYPGMAEAEIERHVEEAKARWPLLGVTVIHRYGRIVPGENIVLVVTASSHREAAFAAAEFLMDYLKTRAPFWKQVEKARRQRPGSRPRRPTTPRPSAGQRRPRARSGGMNAPMLQQRRACMIRSSSRRSRSSRSASSRRRPRRCPIFEVPRGAHPHDVAPAPDGTVWYTGAEPGRARHPRSEDRQGDADSARPGLGAAWRHRRARPRGLDHRRRAERHRALRSGDQGGEAVPAAEGISQRQSQHRDLRPQGHPLVHRPERRLWPRRSGDRQGRGLEGAEGRRPLRHHHDAERRGLVRLARRRSHRARSTP